MLSPAELQTSQACVSVHGLETATWAQFTCGCWVQVEKVMKALHVRKLYLWPRFQAQVKADLEAQPPEVRLRVWAAPQESLQQAGKWSHCYLLCDVQTLVVPRACCASLLKACGNRFFGSGHPPPRKVFGN